MSYNFGKCLLLDRLREVDMRQVDLARKSGRSKQIINDYCHDRKHMALPTAAEFAHILGCTAESLYEWVEKGEGEE